MYVVVAAMWVLEENSRDVRVGLRVEGARACLHALTRPSQYKKIMGGHWQYSLLQVRGSHRRKCAHGHEAPEAACIPVRCGASGEWA
eukprot:365203-Pleurochrysis_carterae.AAC.1